MAIVTLENLIEAGVHFGHRVSRWNPKMAPFIYGKRNLIHIIDLRETVKGLIRAYHFLFKLAAMGEDVLFVGTKRQAKSVVEEQARRSGMHFVNERWLGGTLTNYQTIRSRLARLEEIERMDKDGTLGQYSKKMLSSIAREKRKLLRNLEGIRNMTRLPGAVVLIDPRREHIALKEANRLHIPTICLIDTDSDPELVDIPIPGNDDAFRSIQVILSRLADAMLKGREKRGQTLAASEKALDVARNERKAEKKDEASRKPGTVPAEAAAAPGAPATPAAPAAENKGA